MMLIARCSFFFTALQFVDITNYTVSLRLAKKQQQRTLNTTQLRILGSNIRTRKIISLSVACWIDDSGFFESGAADTAGITNAASQTSFIRLITGYR